MKKLICVLLTLILLCSFVACNGQKEPEVKGPTAAQKVDSLIQAIYSQKNYSGNYRYREEDIVAAEEAYTALSEAEKQEVQNYRTLQEKRATFEHEKIKDSAVSAAEIAAKYSLKTPSSYKNIGTYVHIYYDENKEFPVGAQVTVYFSGTNSFGGTVDNSYYFARLCDKDGIFESENLTLTEFDKQMEAKKAIEVKFGTDLLNEN